MKAFLASIWFFVALLAGLFGYYSENTVVQSLLLNVSAGSALLFVAVISIEPLIQHIREMERKPAKLAAYRELKELYMTVRLLWGRMVADSLNFQGYSGSAPQLKDYVGGSLLTEGAADVVSKLRLGSFVTLSPERTWDEYLDDTHAEILDRIDRCVRRYPNVLSPEQLKLLLDLENDLFIRAIDRKKELIHGDMQRSEFGYGGGAFANFFRTMDEYWTILNDLAIGLAISDEQRVPSRSWAEDLSSNTGDLLARMLIGHTLGGMTYDPRLSYIALMRECIRSPNKYAVHISTVSIKDPTGSLIRDFSVLASPLQFQILDSAILLARQAMDISNICARFDSKNTEWNALMVAVFAVSDIYYPRPHEAAEYHEALMHRVQQAKVSGMYFDRTGRNLHIP